MEKVVGVYRNKILCEKLSLELVLYGYKVLLSPYVTKG